MATKKSLLNSAQNARAGAGRGKVKEPLYDKRQANRISLWIIVVVAAVLGVYVALELSTDPVTVTGDSLRVRALFGFSLPLSDITELELEKAPILVHNRIVGNDAFGLFREGDYEVDGLGRARVFLKKPNLSYLTIRTDEKNYAISLGSVDKNQILYDRIKLGMK
jgi:hypothetical protein